MEFARTLACIPCTVASVKQQRQFGADAFEIIKQMPNAEQSIGKRYGATQTALPKGNVGTDLHEVGVQLVQTKLKRPRRHTESPCSEE